MGGCLTCLGVSSNEERTNGFRQLCPSLCRKTVSPQECRLDFCIHDGPSKSGRLDLNQRPLRPERSALARLSYAPNCLLAL